MAAEGPLGAALIGSPDFDVSEEAIEEEGKPSEGEMVAASDVMEAVKSGDREGLAMALRDYFTILMGR